MLRRHILVPVLAAGCIALAVSSSTRSVAAATPHPPGQQLATGPWGAGQSVDGLAGFLAVPSCAPDGYCAAIDSYGNVVVDHGGRWGAKPKHVVSPGNNDLSCVSSTFCMAIGSHFDDAVFDGTTWHQVLEPSDYPLTAISCAAVDFCLGLDKHSAWVFDGTGWSNQQLIDPHLRLGLVSCSPTRTCIAGDDDGNLFSFSNGVWQGPVSLGLSRIGSMSCAAGSYCLAMDYAGTTVRYTPTRGYSLVASPPITAHSGLACPAPRRCVAVGAFEVSFFDGKTWTQSSALRYGVGAVACSQPDACVAVGDFKVVEYDGSDWKVVRGELGQGVRLETSCPTASFCAVGDYYGNVLTYRDGSWSGVRNVDHSFVGILAVECTSASFCLAGDSDGKVLSFDGTSWSAAQDLGIAAVYALSCASATFCVAGGVDAVSVFDGTTWSRVAIDPGYGIEAVSCASADFCVTLEQNGQDTHAVTWDGTTWSAPKQVVGLPLDPISLQCPSTTFCMAASSNDRYLTYDGTTWSAAGQQPGFPTITSLTCTSETFCISVGDQSRSRWDGQTWGDPVQIDVPPVKHGSAQGVGLTGVSCASPTFCVAVDARGRALVTDQP